MSTNSSKHKDYIPDIMELLPIREFRCEFDCGKVFKNRTPYELHLQRKHGIDRREKAFNSYKCPVANCEYLGNRLGLVRRHYQNHHMEKNYNCDKCSRKFIIESQFTKHRCEAQQYSCKICPKTFRLLNIRNKHVKQCVKKKRHSHGPIKKGDYKQGVDNDHMLILQLDAETDPSNPELNDSIIVDEFEQLLRNIENKTIEDPDLIKELVALTPLLQGLQSET